MALLDVSFPYLCFALIASKGFHQTLSWSRWDRESPISQILPLWKKRESLWNHSPTAIYLHGVNVRLSVACTVELTAHTSLYTLWLGFERTTIPTAPRGGPNHMTPITLTYNQRVRLSTRIKMNCLFALYQMFRSLVTLEPIVHVLKSRCNYYYTHNLRLQTNHSSKLRG